MTTTIHARRKGSRVLCGACGGDLARIERHDGQDVLVFERGWAHQRDQEGGVWRVSKHAQQRQNRGNGTTRLSFRRPPQRVVDAETGEPTVDRFPTPHSYPVRVGCRCGFVQWLDADKLGGLGVWHQRRQAPLVPPALASVLSKPAPSQLGGPRPDGEGPRERRAYLRWLIKASTKHHQSTGNNSHVLEWRQVGVLLDEELRRYTSHIQPLAYNGVLAHVMIALAHPQLERQYSTIVNKAIEDPKVRDDRQRGAPVRAVLWCAVAGQMCAAYGISLGPSWDITALALYHKLATDARMQTLRPNAESPV